jgi:hypothetical protein
VTGLVGGLMQALLPAHLMAIISAALLGACTKPWPSIIFLAAFAAGLAAGLAALTLVGETPAGDVLLAVTFLNGLAAAMAPAAVPRPVVGLIAFIVGAALGLDSPPDSILLRDAIVGLVGTWCAAMTLLVAVPAAATPLTRLWNGLVLRVVGSWIAATAMLVLALRWAS